MRYHPTDIQGEYDLLASCFLASDFSYSKRMWVPENNEHQPDVLLEHRERVLRFLSSDHADGSVLAEQQSNMRSEKG